jgi:hypothetical protein
VIIGLTGEGLTNALNVAVSFVLLAQATLEVSTHCTGPEVTSAKVKPMLSVPAGVPKRSQVCFGVVPPLLSVAVKVINSPGQILFVEAVMVTFGVTNGLIVMPILLEVEINGVAHEAVEVIFAETESLFNNDAVVNCTLLLPELIPLTNHW